MAGVGISVDPDITERGISSRHIKSLHGFVPGHASVPNPGPNAERCIVDLARNPGDSAFQIWQQIARMVAALQCKDLSALP